MHDDDEMNDEISRLGSVVASLQQDLDNVAHTVTDEFGVRRSHQSSRHHRKYYPNLQ